MKTLKRTLCLMLSIIMALSCLSAAAAAVEEEKFTSTLKTATTVSNKESAKLTLDELDKILASLPEAQQGRKIRFLPAHIADATVVSAAELPGSVPQRRHCVAVFRTVLCL